MLGIIFAAKLLKLSFLQYCHRATICYRGMLSSYVCRSVWLSVETAKLIITPQTTPKRH